MYSAVNLRAVEIGDKPPKELDAPGGLFLNQRQRTLLDPYFRNALWYYDAYFLYVDYANKLENLNDSQGQDIDGLLKKAEKSRVKNICLVVITTVSTAAAVVLALIVRSLL